jgi:hypothetical protein
MSAMMLRRIFIFLALAAGVQGAAMAADFGKPKMTGMQSVPGAYVTMEGGVRVIRPVPFDPAWVVNDETPIPGGIVYHGAAFYHVPRALPSKAAHKAQPTDPEKPHAE